MVRSSDSDKVTVIGSGVTLHEALAAADELAASGVNIRVVDPFTIKPIDQEGITAAVRATGGKVIVVEDHYPQGEKKRKFKNVTLTVFISQCHYR